MSNYWSQIEQSAVEEYFRCVTAVTSGATRTRLYSTVIYQVFDLIIDKNLSAFRNLCGDDKDDIRQWAHIRLWQGLDKLKPHMMQGALQYFWTICRNHIYTRAGRAAAHITEDITFVNEHNLPDNPMTADKNIIQQDLRIQIMQELDKKLLNCKSVTISYVYLSKLKQFLLDNEYDATGFDKYICNELNLTDESFRVINSRLKIKTKIFKSINTGVDITK